MPELSRTSACLSDLVLDEWAAGELDRGESARVDEHVASCERCRTRNEEFERQRHAFLQAAPNFEAHARLLRAHAPAPSRSRFIRPWLGVALAACAAALLTLLPKQASRDIRAKGTAHVDYFVKRGARVERSQAFEALRPGDQLRFTYSTARERYFALLDRDPRKASIYYPARALAAKVPAGTDVPLDFSVQLDEVLGEELVYAVFCDEPFAIEPLRAELARSAELHAGPGCEVDVLSLRKQAAP